MFLWGIFVTIIIFAHRRVLSDISNGFEIQTFTRMVRPHNINLDDFTRLGIFQGLKRSTIYVSYIYKFNNNSIRTTDSKNSLIHLRDIRCCSDTSAYAHSFALMYATLASIIIAGGLERNI